MTSFRSSCTHLSRTLLSRSLLTALLGLAPVLPALAQANAAQTFAIPAQSLSAALAEFTRQSRAQVVLASGTQASGITTRAVNGALEPDAALERLLDGTGLVARRADNGDFIVSVRDFAPTTQRRGAIETLVVIGQPLDRLLSDQDIARRQANDLDDLFSGYSTVMVGGSVGAAQKLYVRNLGEDTLNIMVDGATQAGVTYHHSGRITIEPELLKQVQVQVGAGEATNGPGALGGAIRFETKDPTDLLEGRRFGGMVKTGYFSNTDGSKLSATAYGQLSDSWSVMGSVVSADQDRIEDARGVQLQGTDSQQDLYFGKLVGEIAQDQRLSFSYEQLTEDGNKSRRPEWIGGPGNPEWFLEFDRRTLTANHDWNPVDNDLLNLETTVYRTEFDIYRPIDTYTSAVDTLGVLLRNTSRFGAHELVYGIDFRDDEVTAGDISFPNEEQETASVLGFYVQEHFQASDTLLLSIGTRYDQYELTDDDGADFDADGFSPNVGFSWEPHTGLTFSGGYAEAMRGPETNDGFKLFGTTNAPDLEAERAKNLEFGVEYESGRFTWSAGLHDLTIEDVIGNALPWSRHYQNLGELDSDGYTLGLAYAGKRLQASIDYVDTEGEINGEPLTRYAYGYLGTSAGNSVSLNLAWTATQQLELGWIGQLVQGLDDLYVVSAGAAIDKPGYGVHDFYAQWRPQTLGNFSLTLTLKNAFDKQYLDHGSIEDFTQVPDYAGVVGSPAAGRDIRVTAALSF